MHAPEGATKADIAGVNANIAEFKVDTAAALAELGIEIAAVEARLERSTREMSVRFLILLIASRAVLFAGLRLTGG